VFGSGSDFERMILRESTAEHCCADFHFPVFENASLDFGDSELLLKPVEEFALLRAIELVEECVRTLPTNQRLDAPFFDRIGWSLGSRGRIGMWCGERWQSDSLR
jgi:hypothetical protein